ncbi:hypothetical protein F4778DRAFT_705593 [Xylariomycetidae sp. FL2044]|nr:hypothetical protein F4778DRAFT_705593 [Xylariomycetidae sp. FL2044]
MKRRNLPDMIKALENLPPSIEECYEMMLLEIDEHDRPLARAVFTFVDAHNKLKDTQILPLHSVISMINKNQDNANPLNRQHDRTDIQEVCGCLITLVNATFGREGSRDEVTYEGVKLAHYSVLEYLYSERIKHSAAAFFAMEENANIHAFLTETLGTTLLANTVTGPPAFWHDYEHFCARVALLAPRRWEFRVVQNHNLWNIMSRIWCKKYGYYWHTSELFDFRLSRPSGCSVRITIARKPYVATLQETKAATMAAFLFDNLRDIPQRFLKENTYDEILGWTVDLQESDDDEFFEYNVNIAVSALCAGISVSSFGEPGKSLDQQRYFGPEEQLIVLVVRHRFCRRCHGEKQEGKCSLRDHPSLANCDLSQHSYSSRFAPLQISTTQRDYDATKFLLERGANPNTLGSPTGWWTVDDVTNRTYFAGESPLWRARNAGGNRVVPDKIVALLLDYGAKYFREESRRRH